MINGIIKLFYSEIVKVKMNGMYSGDYIIRDECKEIRNITLKIESVFFKLIKLILCVLLLVISFNISILLGMGTLLVEITYVIYKIKLEKQALEAIKNLKNNIELPQINTFSERSKSQLNALIILLIIGLISDFNWIIVISFVLVFLFTIKDIYSNIK